MKLRSGSRTDVGRVRDHNEDTFLVQPPLFAVADGMGGHEAGEVASSLAVATVSESAVDDVADPEQWVGRLVDDANAAVFAKGTQQGGALRMGTTLTMAFAAPDALYLGHVGDSRAYILHDGHLRQITDDHSLVAEWVRQGRITAEEAAVHPQRSVITRALGIDADVQVDVLRVVPSKGDRLLLCSDGLTGCVSDADIAEVLRDVAEPDDAATALVELANEGGGEDNITAVIVDVLDDPAPSSPRAPAEAAAAAATPAETATPTTTATMPAVIEHAPPPERDLPPEARRQARREERGGHSWVRFAVWVVVFAALAAGAWIGLALVTSNSYYVGADSDVVAIYRGLPKGFLGSAAGQELVESTPVMVAELPEIDQRRLTDGITADNLDDARKIVGDLQRLTPTSTTSTTTSTTTTTTTPPPPLPPPTPVPPP